jgi:predicted ribosomally synthesized peptide with nif11-like leader
MTTSAEMLLKKMEADKSFTEKILSRTEMEEVIEIAKGEGIELTMEDIGEINEAIAKALQSKKEGELTAEELENVAGGDVMGGVYSIFFITQLGAVGAVVLPPGFSPETPKVSSRIPSLCVGV